MASAIPRFLAAIAEVALKLVGFFLDKARVARERREWKLRVREIRKKELAEAIAAGDERRVRELFAELRVLMQRLGTADFPRRTRY